MAANHNGTTTIFPFQMKIAIFELLRVCHSFMSAAGMLWMTPRALLYSQLSIAHRVAGIGQGPLITVTKSLVKRVSYTHAHARSTCPSVDLVALPLASPRRASPHFGFPGILMGVALVLARSRGKARVPDAAIRRVLHRDQVRPTLRSDALSTEISCALRRDQTCSSPRSQVLIVEIRSPFRQRRNALCAQAVHAYSPG